MLIFQGRDCILHFDSPRYPIIIGSSIPFYWMIHRPQAHCMKAKDAYSKRKRQSRVLGRLPGMVSRTAWNSNPSPNLGRCRKSFLRSLFWAWAEVTLWAFCWVLLIGAIFRTEQSFSILFFPLYPQAGDQVTNSSSLLENKDRIQGSFKAAQLPVFP